MNKSPVRTGQKPNKQDPRGSHFFKGEQAPGFLRGWGPLTRPPFADNAFGEGGAR
jgi:hypothetical protein